MSNYDKINTLFKFECIVLFKSNTAWKVSVFGVILVRIQSECGKIQTGLTWNIDTFYAEEALVDNRNCVNQYICNEIETGVLSL